MNQKKILYFMILKRLWFFILALLFCYKTLNLNSVAEPEPVAAGRSRSEQYFLVGSGAV